MADPNPTHDPRVVPIDLSAEHLEILRLTLTDCLAGARDDLQDPERLENPELVRRDVAAYERLLVAVERLELLVPDEEARSAMQALAAGFDKVVEYADVAANHDALHGLLGLLEVGERR